MLSYTGHSGSGQTMYKVAKNINPPNFLTEAPCGACPGEKQDTRYMSISLQTLIFVRFLTPINISLFYNFLVRVLSSVFFFFFVLICVPLSFTVIFYSTPLFSIITVLYYSLILSIAHCYFLLFSNRLAVSSQCCEGGIISPTNCVYITKWLAVPDDHNGNEW